MSEEPIAKHAALNLPEIVAGILEASDQADRAASARVCREWSTIALDKLWRSLDSLLPLFVLLSPVVMHDTLDEIVSVDAYMLCKLV